jgi:hypothetical protein
MVPETVHEPVGDDICLLLIAHGEDGGEIVAGVPGGDVALADGGFEDR